VAQNILALFEETVQRFGPHTALAEENDKLTFSELQSLSRRLGRWLLEKGLGGKAIGVLADQTIYTPVLYLGVAYAGGCYVPLDPDAPAEKQKKVVSSCKAPLVLTWKQEDGDKLENEGFTCADLEDALGEFSDGALESPEHLTRDAALYLIYTSGSTGEPKGILKTHGAVLDFIGAYLQTFSFGPEDVLGCQTPFFFDASAKDLFMMLAAGCKMELLSKRLFVIPKKLVEYLNQRGVTVISWVPSALTVVSRLNTFRSVKPATLRRVMFVGEVFQPRQLALWREACPNVEFVNLYGSSEIAGVCCYYRVEGKVSEDSPLPMGKPLPNCKICLLSDGEPTTAPGVLGELYIASKALASCYLGDEEKTRQSFITAEFDGVPRRWFKTGDLARYDEQGNLVFASRGDFQIKHTGHRIELGEIEAAAASLPGVVAACCLYQQEREMICLFCTGAERDSGVLMGKLRAVLPPYMVPKRYFFLDEMPLTPSGKMDRMALQREYLS